MLDSIEKFDFFYLKLFHSMQSKSNDLFFSYITWLGSLWVLLPLFFFLIVTLFKHAYNEIIFPISIGFFGAIATTYVLKHTIERTRPNMYEVIGILPKDPSFPSAHTTQVFIFIFSLILVSFFLDLKIKHYLSIFLLLSAFLVAISRVYLQVHYMSDIIAGMLISLFWIYITYKLLYK